MKEFKTWDTLALVRLARILKLTKSVQTAKEYQELELVMAELRARDSAHLVQQ